MASPDQIKSIRDAIDQEIASLQSQADNARAHANRLDQSQIARGDLVHSSAGQAVISNPGETLYQLNDQIHRLEQVRNWIEGDFQFAKFIDNFIGRQVQAAERRQNRFNFVLNAVLLLAGWLLGILPHVLFPKLPF